MAKRNKTSQKKKAGWGDLSGKVAVITGGSRGVGFGCAQAMLEGGAKVVIASRDRKKLEDAKTRLGVKNVAIYAGDALDEKSAIACLKFALKTFGSIDILINNAGGAPKDSWLVDLPVEDFDLTLARNMRTPFVWTKHAWHLWMKDKGGVVINIASNSAVSIPPRMGIYAASKAGLKHLTSYMGAEMGPKVRVNAIAPGLTRSDATASIFGALESQLASVLPAQRLGEPSDIGQMARFLASDECTWMTGETIVVDGGSTIQRGRLTAHRDNAKAATKK